MFNEGFNWGDSLFNFGVGDLGAVFVINKIKR